jgi:hypothetical protein
VIKVLLERLRNDITRLAAVKAVDTLARSRLDLRLADSLEPIMVRVCACVCLCACVLWV